MGHLAHAYLFIGPPHVGKTTLALDLAKALNCHEAKPPCGECQSCRRIANSKHSDVTIIGLSPNKSLGETKLRIEIGIDDIKNLQRSASLPPYEGKCKIFIIDGAEYLSSEASNCLLKTLEEPPSKVVVLLLAAEEGRLLPTIVSRCQRVELRPMPSEEIGKELINSFNVDKDKAKLLTQLSQGCLGWALTASTNDSSLNQRTQKLSEMLSLLNAGWEERFVYAAQLRNNRNPSEEMLKLWLTWWRDVILTKCGCKQTITNIDYALAIEEWSQTLSLLEIKDFIDSLQKSLVRISRNANLQLVLETLMLDMPKKEGGSKAS